MDVGTVLSVSQTLLAALQCPELRHICSVLNYKSELDNLENIVDTVKAVLLDAEARADHEELSRQALLFIDQLKDAVYDADDLLDEFATRAQRKHKKLIKESVGKVLEKFRCLLSRIKGLPAAYSMSRDVKMIREKLDAIAHNHNNFGFKLDTQPIRKRMEETCSYVYAYDIIGRDDDKKAILGRLLDPHVNQHDVSFLTIVGMGGLGKTALAQIIYNDERIIKEFPMRLWVCVGDEDTKHLKVKLVLAKILESLTDDKHDESTLDSLQRKVREQLANKKYLLVLDDIWNENRNEWLGLENYLKGGPSGSWVVVTTRSSNTARIIGDGFSYELKGLSEEDSWNLFERVAFRQIQGQSNPAELVEIGKKIVKKCANVPLAIRVVGSLLYDQGRDKWLSFEKNRLTEVSSEKNSILPILKFSYHRLDSSLKSCFSYCALFPKDHRMKKDMLISLWMAQGFIVPLEKGQSMEHAGEEYVLIFIRRCFFQDVEKDANGEIISFKLHDLMHDVAQKVSGKEVCIVDCITSDLDKKIRHLSVAEHTETVGSLTKSTVRTLLYLHWKKPRLSVGTLLDNWMNLRALDLSRSDIINLPDRIGKLLHLRYLDLSANRKMKVLPKSFTKLHNLETLILNECSSLIELPNDFCKLAKLRCLDMKDCDRIRHMPAGMNKLSCLHKLTMFVVDLRNLSCGDSLEDLQVLTKVKGHLQIRIYDSENATYERRSNREEGYLMNKKHLHEIWFIFQRDDGEEDNKNLALMEDMQPYCDLRRICIWEYKGEKLPRWARGDNLATSLPNLVKIEIKGCDGLEYLPPLGKLGHLKFLKVGELRKLEYMEEQNTGAGGVDDSFFFPSLELLDLQKLPRLKGWWREEEELPSFPHLSMLLIYECPKLALILGVPKVELVYLYEVDEKLRVRGAEMEEKGEGEGEGWPTCSSYNSKSRQVVTDKVRCIRSLPSITELSIESDKKTERLEEVLDHCFSSLRILDICDCDNLKSIDKGGLQHLTALKELSIKHCPNLKSVGKGGLQHLTALEKLSIKHCPNLTLTQEQEGEDIRGDDPSSPPFLQSLRYLRLNDLPKVVNLPQWMQHLTSLHSLEIYKCESLESLPEWMPHLTSLTHLKIMGCSKELEQRCRKSPPN